MRYPDKNLGEFGMATKCSKGVSVTTDHMVHMRQHRGHRNAYAHHRKSAVELLEASKSEYVKSRQVLNHRQELKHPENLSISSEPVGVFAVQTRNAALEDVSNTLSEGHNRKLSEDHSSRKLSEDHQSHRKSPEDHSKRKLSEDYSNRKLSDQSNTSALSSHHGPTQNENKPRCLSPKSNLGATTPKKADSSQTGTDEQASTFKKPLTPPKPLPKPTVPPKPANKPSTPPVPGPKPVVLDSTGKPLPPPRPSRKCVDQVDSAPKMSAHPHKPGASATPTTTANSDNPDTVSKRFSSLSAHATVGKDSGDKNASGDKNGAGPLGRDREARCSVGSQNEASLKPLCSSILSTSVGVLLEKQRSPMPKPRVERQLEEVEIPPRRQLHRSHSDLSSCRHSRASSDFSDLSSRLSRTSTEVERFFNEMGLDRTVLEPMRKLAETKRKDFMVDSNSSLDSISGQSLSSRLSQNDLDKLPIESEQDLMDRSTASGTTSVVERNARIIKWLCNVKKARTAPGQSKRRVKPVPGTSS